VTFLALLAERPYSKTVRSIDLGDEEKNSYPGIFDFRIVNQWNGELVMSLSFLLSPIAQAQ
jgi:hypothetical protein